ncbi:MAG TPA: DPP IV N-terminal domain-containing protein, partial [Flavobacteriales bacterium]|nr:DPP IV N-terminal domain-containing protein [Flavobacteriales bacterium]
MRKLMLALYPCVAVFVFLASAGIFKRVYYTGFLFAIGITVNAQQLDVATVWASPAFYQENVDEVASMNDGEHYSVLETENGGLVINKYSFKTFKKVATIFAAKDVMIGDVALEFDSYEFNSDETKLLLTTNTEYIYRRSFTATYYVYDLKTKTISLLADSEKGPQQLADISPDGQKVAFVRANNIFYKDLKTGEEVQVTTDGKRNAIINGTTDWVYEEEFSITKGFYWSPTSTEIAYYKFDESNVKEFQFDTYGALYPEHYTYKYPKAGEDNSKISIHLYSLAGKNTKNISTGPDADIYLPRMAWDPKKGYLVVLRMNRLQNKLEYCMVDVKAAAPELKPFYTETSETYVEVTDDLIFLANQEGLIRTSEKDGFNHIWKIDYAGKETQITKGNWDVIELKGLDEKGGWIYYASAESGPTQKELFRIKMDGTGKVKLSKRKGTNDATFSTGMKYFMNYNSSANVPLYVTLHTADGKEL